jgi:hypothetical protein
MTRHPSVPLWTVILASTLLAACASAPQAMPATPVADCAALAAQLEQAQAAERAAAQRQHDAWKAVVPFAVLARAAGGKAAVAEQQQRQDDLRGAAARQGCHGGGLSPSARGTGLRAPAGADVATQAPALWSAQ